MKKTLITIALATVAALSTQAQGLVIFSSGTQNISTNNGTIGKTTTTPGSFYYALFVSATATTVGGTQTGAIQGTNGVYAFSDSNWSFVGYGTNSGTAGRFQPLGSNADGSTTVNGVAAGNSAQFVVIGWSANLGSTISSLQSALAAQGTTGLLGESVVSGAIATGNGGLLPTPSLFQSSAPAIQAFTLGAFSTPLAPTPEPATLALAGLSGASLLLFRRRK